MHIFRYWPAVAIASLSTFLVLVAQGTYVPSGTFNSFTPMAAAREGASSAVLIDGRILVTGGKDDSGNPLDTAEILGGFSAGQMHAARAGHISVTLKDGTVLVAGGSTPGDGATNATEIYDPSAGSWTVAAHSMLEARIGATATLLSDGRVLISGGDNGSGPLQTTEIYDPASGVFSSAAPLSSPRKNHAATLLNDGRVAIAGGMGVGSDGQTLLPLNSIDIYDPLANTVSPLAATMSAARVGLSATTLLKGHVLLAGGGTAPGAASATTDILDVTAGTVIPGPGMSAARTGHLALLLPNNNTVLMVSGASDSAAAEIYVPWQNVFTPFGALAAPRTGATGGASGQIGAASIAGGQVSGTASSVVETIHFPMVKTDKPDYAPGETAQITGSGFVPGEVVNLSIEEIPDLDTDSPIQLQATADALGNISTTLPIDNADANIRFYLTATGATSGLTAGMTFTDNKVQTVVVASPTSVTVAAGVTAVYGSVTVTVGGNAGSCVITLAATGLPAGASAVFGTNPLTSTGPTDNPTTSFSVTTTGATVPGTYTPVNVTAKDGTGCQDTKTQTSNDLTLIVAAPVKTTPTFSGLSSPTINYGTASTTLSMTVVGSGTNVPTGSFTIALNGGAPQTATFVSSTANSATYSSVFSTGSLGVSGSPYSIGYHYGGDANYNPISPDGSGTLTVSPKPATWTTNANSKAYGDPDPVPLTTGSGSGFLAADGVTATYSRAAGETVTGGPYHITATLSATGSLSNYTITNAGADFTINTKAAMWTTNANSKTYGDADPVPLTTGSGSGFLVADGVTATYSRVAGETVAGGPYHITATLSPAGVLSNYTITNTGAGFTVNQKSVTPSITANDKTYDGNSTATLATCAVAVKVGLDDVACTSSTVTFASPNANASAQVVTATGITLTGTTSGNYSLSTTTATTNAKINPKPATWTTNANSKTYGDPDPAPLTTGSGSGFLVGDGVTATYNRVAGETVLGGPYHITATLSATGLLTNYTITNAGADFTINAKPATWTTNANSKTYGDADPVPLTRGSGSGFLVADGVTASYSRAAGETVGGGPYHITATLSPSGVLSNYTITNTGASFTINQKSVTPSITANEKTYDGNNTATLATCTVAVKVGGDDVACSSSTVTFASSNASASAQVVTATGITLTGGTAGNYSLSMTTATTYAKINPKPATWITNANNKTFGNPDPVPLTTGSGSGFLVADSVTATYSRTAGETVLGGPYHITATLSATGLLTNYTITNLGANFTITPLTVVTTVTISQTSQQYSDLVTFNAKVSPIAVGAFTAATGADFYVGTQKVGSCALDNLTGSCTTALSAALLEPTPFGTLPTGQMAPGNHQVTAKFTGLNPNFIVPDATTYDGTSSTILAITPEDARVDYTGQNFVATVNSSVNVPLTFTIRDSNALLPADGVDYTTYYDANPGDIQNALVTIKVNGNAPSGCSSLTPALISADSRTGTVGCVVSLAVNTVPYNITVDVSNYYQATAESDTTQTVVVSLASGTGFITGGGYTINGTAPDPTSQGTYKGDSGRKTNYGFNVQYNKKGTNLQGNANIIIRGGGHSYQIKANSMQSLVVSDTTVGGTATFVSKANLTDVTNPDNPIVLGGNYSLTLSLVDNGEPGTADNIGIQLFNGNTLLFSNNWNGVQTVNKLIDGGNLMVH